jgi:hypothetical protein
MSARLFWCRKCGMVWAATEPPICRHNVPPSRAVGAPPAAWMEPLPPWHPFAAGGDAE